MSTMQEEHESNVMNTASEGQNGDQKQENVVASSDEQQDVTEQSGASEAEDASAEAKEESADTQADSAEGEEASAEAKEGSAEAKEGSAETAEGSAEAETDASEDDVEVEEEEEDEKTKYKRAVEALVDEITEKLEEPNIYQTRKVVYAIGIEKCKEYLEKALELEEAGGVVVERRRRRRTPGGIFYWLIKEDLTHKEIKELFPYKRKPVNKAKRNAARKARKVRKREELIKEVTESWANRADVIKEVIKSKNYGKAKSIKVTMIGRPGKIIKQKGFIMTTMRGPERSPSLPRELPEVIPSRLVYLVYIGNKQWKRVAKRIKNPEDTLIIEGYLSYEKALKKMVIFGQMVTTIHIQQERREKQRQEAEKKKAAEEAKKLAEAEKAAA